MISDPGREPMLDSPATQTVTSPSAGQAGGALLRAHPAALAALYAVAATVLMTMAEQLLPASLSCYASGFLIGLTAILLFVLRSPARATPAPALIQPLVATAPTAATEFGTSPLPADPDPLFREALRDVRHVLYRFNPTHESYDYISDCAESWLGTPIDALCAPGGWHHFARRVITDDLGRVWAQIGDALRTPGTEPVGITVEYRLDSAHAGQIWVRDAMTLLRHPDGSLKAIVGCAADQTDDRAARVAVARLDPAEIDRPARRMVGRQHDVAEAEKWNLPIVLIVLLAVFASAMNERKKEFAAYRIMGATRGTLIALIVKESALIGLVGGVIGIAGASLAVFPFNTLISRQLQLPYLQTDALKVVVLVAISLVFAVATGLLASIVTAVKLSAPETYLTLREGE
mgnify:CR=1 FL=1